ncbi:MAG: CRISPR-associated helicase Cas3', partial [Gammaproteobacteria bacterium]
MGGNLSVKTRALMRSYFKYWAKAGEGEEYHLLPYHSLDVAACAVVLFEKVPYWQRHLLTLLGREKEEISTWLRFWVALHDLGKFAVSFQRLRRDLLQKLQAKDSQKSYSIRHDTLGYLLWKERLVKKLDERGLLKTTRRARFQIPNLIMSVMSGHHGKPPDEEKRIIGDYFDEEEDLEAAIDFVEDWLNSCKLGCLPLFEDSNLKIASWWIAGLCTLADWLGSNKDFFPFERTEISLDHYWESALKQAGKALRKTGLSPAEPAANFELKDCFARPIPHFHPTPLQAWVEDKQVKRGPALYILEEVTGSGKTEAALLLAYKLMVANGDAGMYIGLPTMATANGMYQRLAAGKVPVYRRMFQPSFHPTLVLAHSRADFMSTFHQSIMPQPPEEPAYGDGTEPASVFCSTWLADSRKKALLAHVGVGTIDQALLATLAARHQSLRVLGLLGKVFVVDEVHACDAYMNKLLENILWAHARGGGTAILLSATLPENQKKSLIGAFAGGAGWELPALDFNEHYPLVTELTEGQLHQYPLESRESVKRRVDVSFVHEQGDILDLVREKVREGKCLCWISNTVRDAQARYEFLNQNVEQATIELFHARFTLKDRISIEEQVIRNYGKHSGPDERKGRILVAT